MTISQAIGQLDSLMHNTYSDHQKKVWLSAVDGMISALILNNAGENAPEGEELLARPPFDAMYLHYLQAQIHYQNGEFDRYNNAIAMFQSCFDSYRNHCNRQSLRDAAVIRYF